MVANSVELLLKMSDQIVKSQSLLQLQKTFWHFRRIIKMPDFLNRELLIGINIAFFPILNIQIVVLHKINYCALILIKLSETDLSDTSK